MEAQFAQYFYEISNLQNRSKLVNSQKRQQQVQQSHFVNHLQNFQSQATQIMRSPQAMEAEQALSIGQKFQDRLFPPNNASLYGRKLPKDWAGMKYRWGRMHELYEAPKIFQERIEADDIKQGQLGTCYFLAALSALSESPKRIANLFITRKINAALYYSVKILHRGIWREVVIDDWIPCVEE